MNPCLSHSRHERDIPFSNARYEAVNPSLTHTWHETKTSFPKFGNGIYCTFAHSGIKIKHLLPNPWDKTETSFICC